jgi:hypothetical protein
METLSVTIRATDDDEHVAAFAHDESHNPSIHELMGFQYVNWKEVHVSCVNMCEADGRTKMTSEGMLQMAENLRTMLLSTPEEIKRKKKEMQDKKEDGGQKVSNQEENNQEESNQEESNQEESNQEDSNQEESNQEESNQEESNQEDSNQEESIQQDEN